MEWGIEGRKIDLRILQAPQAENWSLEDFGFLGGDIGDADVEEGTVRIDVFVASRISDSECAATLEARNRSTSPGNVAPCHTSHEDLSNATPLYFPLICPYPAQPSEFEPVDPLWINPDTCRNHHNSSSAMARVAFQPLPYTSRAGPYTLPVGPLSFSEAYSIS
jgi:hypothetical protein